MAVILIPNAPTLESRAQVGLLQPRSVSRDVRPQDGGLAVHHGGDALAPGPDRSHGACRARVKGWQDYHMNGHGWVDIAYNWAVCQHGVVMVCRGYGVRSAANGTNDANDRYLAVCWLGGGAQQPTPQAVAAVEWLVGECRRRGAGKDVQPHRHFFQTSCPGDALSEDTDIWRGATILEPGAKPTPSGKPPAAKVPSFPLPTGYYFGPATGGARSISGRYPLNGRNVRPDLARWQGKVGGLLADGLYGPKTAARARAVQQQRRIVVDGLVGPATWQAAWK